MYNKLFIPLQHSGRSGILLNYYLVYFYVIIYKKSIKFAHYKNK